MNTKADAFTKLLEVVYELRQKCPWDKEQTWESLRPLTIEETYELTDAIISNDAKEVKKELGDVLLHVLFYAMIGEEKKEFDIAEVCNALREKLIIRHPHIYGDVVADTPDAVKKNWEQIKLKEGTKSVLAGVPKSLPALVKASRLQDKASSVGFDWDSPADVLNKVKEEFAELTEAVDSLSKEKMEDEFGDVLFSLINYARFIGVSPDNALERTNQKFIRRFTYLEEQVSNKGLQLQNMTLEEMDTYWNEAKKQEKQS
ncbi:MAG: nucleoside triphosphate pyrophosphohydrolase [Bacteroidetes bacterium]|nr:nucleoside triphosphate pyrophosphohydrolase [Bacteroidota bacterium]